MPEEPKLETSKVAAEVVDEAIVEGEEATALLEEEEDDEDDNAEATTTAGTTASGPTSKKKKSKRKKIKAALGVSEKSEDSVKEALQNAVSGLSKAQLTELLSMNPALARELGAGPGGDLSDAKVSEAFEKLSLQDIMAGLASSGKNVKDMASYKFWQTQPVPKFGETKELIEEGPFKIVDPEKVPKQPSPLPDGFEWVTMDITQEDELKEVYDLLNGHYVEDDAAMFRFNYSVSFLRW
jgi:glycylpeptide N-tetradecanoyltransferase